MLRLLKSLVLLVVAIALGSVLLPLGMLWTLTEIAFRFLFPSGKSAGEKGLGYLSSIIRSIAVGIDQIGNSVCRDLFNRCLIKKSGYSFGKVQETISSVLGKNQEAGSLTRVGRAVVGVLNRLDKDHCRESIITFTSLEHKKNER